MDVNKRTSLQKTLPKESNYNVTELCRIFGENMGKVRKDRGLTSELLGKFLGLSTAYVGLIERGERTPSLKVFLNICDFFGENSEDMLTRNAYSKSNNLNSSHGTFVENKLARKHNMASNMIKTFNADEVDHMVHILKSFRNLRRNS